MELSIVIPVYNSEAILSKLVQEIESKIDFVDSFELILVNDNSPDDSWEKIKELKNKYTFIRGINLMKNYSQHNAVMAGMNIASGRVVVTMDDDLQHSPSDVIEIYNTIVRGGYDVCYAEFNDKKHENWKKTGSKFNNIVANYLIKKPKELYLSPFRGISKKIRDLIVEYNGPFPYVDGLILSVTKNITSITVEHHKREDGLGNYTLLKSIALWAKMATGFSISPLRFATYLGCVVSFTSFLFLILLIIQKMTLDLMPDGWSTITVLILFFGGIQLLSLGIIGEYVGRIYLSINKKAQFLVREII